jgi:hypothetical protein
VERVEGLQEIGDGVALDPHLPLTADGRPEHRWDLDDAH